MEIKILGSGCAKCKRLEKEATDAVNELGIDATITKVEDIMDIMNYGIAATPALVIDEKVMVKGRIAFKDEIKKMLK